MAEGVLPAGHVARRLRITGRVQGVGYRAWAVETASGLGLDGWARNRTDGSVEALIVGEAAAVEDFIRRAHEGPMIAKVDGVEAMPAKGIVASGFVQKPTV
ncbi:acylphosphatase [Sphingoaurantiacus capsulatus]|uniref:acylphosphatase n=1 Tax=Sphingoaurantiacus capsulatus TaxID=1771310 RepID=A0ABV7X9D1_9SPHN